MSIDRVIMENWATENFENVDINKLKPYEKIPEFIQKSK